MNPKIVKINAEHAKNAAKIARLQARNRELEKQRTELENTDIIGLVREVGLTPDQLAALIRGAPLIPKSPESVADGPEALDGADGYADYEEQGEETEETAYEEE